MCSRWLTAIAMFISLASICFFAHNQGNAPFTLIAFNDTMTHNILESSAPLALPIVIILLYSYFEANCAAYEESKLLCILVEFCACLGIILSFFFLILCPEVIQAEYKVPKFV
jgi:hypothetical protein